MTKKEWQNVQGLNNEEMTKILMIMEIFGSKNIPTVINLKRGENEN